MSEGLGLHTIVEIRYEVDQYRAVLLHESGYVIREEVGKAPAAALRALIGDEADDV